MKCLVSSWLSHPNVCFKGPIFPHPYPYTLQRSPCTICWLVVFHSTHRKCKLCEKSRQLNKGKTSQARDWNMTSASSQSTQVRDHRMMSKGTYERESRVIKSVLEGHYKGALNVLGGYWEVPLWYWSHCLDPWTSATMRTGPIKSLQLVNLLLHINNFLNE